MPRRPREHEIEDISRNCLNEAFASRGWVVENLRHDYGEDLLVRIFENGEATPFFFFVQAKATDHIERYQITDESILSYPISMAHLRSWNQLWEPVLITVCDVRTGTTYWQSIQAIVESQTCAFSTSQKTMRVHIPKANTLDPEGLTEILEQTKRRFGRFEQEHEGGKALVALLQDARGESIQYDAQAGILILGGIEDGWTISVWGEMEEHLKRIAQEQGIDLSEFLLRGVYDLATKGSQDFGTFEEFKQWFQTDCSG
jgi:hypothetical protein